MAELLARSAASVLASLPVVSSVRGRVHEAVLMRMPQGLPQMAEVARALDTTTRTLRRWLAAEELTFESVRDEALLAIARDRLADPRSSMAEIAYLLGFSDLRAFHRAFKRWTGVTPGQYRRTLGG